MLSILGNRRRICGGLTRREVLQVSGAGLFGLSLPQLLAAEAGTPIRTGGRAKSVIFLFLFGGPSQLETFDMKPDAPEGIRGPFKPIASRTPGLRICEHLPLTAAVSDKLCVIRSMTHKYNDHSTAGHYIQTGHPWPVPIGGGFNATPADWPSMGSVVEYLAQQAAGRATDVPAHLYLPNRLGYLQTYSSKLDRPGQYAGWLGRGYDAMATDIQKRDAKDNPYFRDCTDDELDFRIKGLAADEGLSIDRLKARGSLLAQFDAARTAFDKSRAIDDYQQYQQQALTLITAGKTRDALDVCQESAALRDRYGRHLFGQSTLVARRLSEAGARFVTVAWDTANGYSWDSHRSSDDLKQSLIPGLDQTLSALLTDLDDRGLLDETLVVCCGEMGRTPNPTKTWGRGHWSTLFPAVLAGAGVRGGTTYGSSDADARLPQDHPTSPEDLAATVFHALGIDPDTRIMHPSGRPVPLVEGVRPLLSLFG